MATQKKNAPQKAPAPEKTSTTKAPSAPNPTPSKSPYGHRLGTTAEIMDNFVAKTLAEAEKADTPAQVSVAAMVEATGYKTGKLRTHLRYLLKKVPDLKYEIIQ
ncbi:hypothetical protein DSCW_32680 [Desulfosarcina widdelii]|uniref:Uncharacterized protein n=1 Tax=Desulfosarcina widdelii TaxID=947919 RepID=A0A5K7Z835_9BACT|nr:hypothetical protein [Desulfosarcina widdelii]BBO75851.1 hypothetical protein DSCW_32680 [Desulfosarcina widdelii]